MSRSYEFKLADFAPDGTLRFADGSTEILLIQLGEEVKAYSGVCPHLGGPMLECRRQGDQLVCPWHDYAFRTDSGACVTVPGSKWKHSMGVARTQSDPLPIRLKTLRCHRQGDTVTVQL